MIQRKQTLFLLQLVFFGLALMFIPVGSVVTPTATTSIYLTPSQDSMMQYTASLTAALVIDTIAVILALVTIFLYRKRNLQVKLCYAQAVTWAILTFMLAACPFAVKTGEVTAVNVNYFCSILAALGIFAAILAARFIKKDIELLKSADRIR